MLNWRTQYTIRLPKLCREGLDLWYALPRHHSARPRPQLTGCFALQEHRPHASRLIASALITIARLPAVAADVVTRARVVLLQDRVALRLARAPEQVPREALGQRVLRVRADVCSINLERVHRSIRQRGSVRRLLLSLRRREQQPNVKYCGIVTHIISWFFPCICCCPIDEHRADEEVYIGIKTIICCLLLYARTPPFRQSHVSLLVSADRACLLSAVTRGCSASRSTCGRGRRCSRRSSSPAAACRSSRS